MAARARTNGARSSRDHSIRERAEGLLLLGREIVWRKPSLGTTRSLNNELY